MKKKSKAQTVEQVRDGANFGVADILRFAAAALKSKTITKDEMKRIKRLAAKAKEQSQTDGERAEFQTLIQKVVGVKSNIIGGNQQWN